MSALSPEERSLYPLVLYVLVWPILYGLATRYVSPPALGMAIAGFVWLLGSWFIPPRVQRKRFKFLTWLGISSMVAVVLFAVRSVIERLFDAA